MFGLKKRAICHADHCGDVLTFITSRVFFVERLMTQAVSRWHCGPVTDAQSLQVCERMQLQPLGETIKW